MRGDIFGSGRICGCSGTKLPYLQIDKIQKPRHVKRGAFLQTRSEEFSTPWALVCGYCLASSLASHPTGSGARAKVGPREWQPWTPANVASRLARSRKWPLVPPRYWRSKLWTTETGLPLTLLNTFSDKGTFSFVPPNPVWVRNLEGSIPILPVWPWRTTTCCSRMSTSCARWLASKYYPRLLSVTLLQESVFFMYIYLICRGHC